MKNNNIDEEIDKNSREIGFKLDGMVWYINDAHKSFDGLMDLVFECNNTQEYMFIIIKKESVELEYSDEEFGYYDKMNWVFSTKKEFILALQRCIIIYLNLKNLQGR